MFAVPAMHLRDAVRNKGSRRGTLSKVSNDVALQAESLPVEQVQFLSIVALHGKIA